MVIFNSYVSLPEGTHGSTSGPRVSSGFFLQINGKTHRSGDHHASPQHRLVRAGFHRPLLYGLLGGSARLGGTKCRKKFGFGWFFWGFWMVFWTVFLVTDDSCETFFDVERYWLVNEGCCGHFCRDHFESARMCHLGTWG